MVQIVFDFLFFCFFNHVILAVMLPVNYCSQEQNVTLSVWTCVVITD